MGTEREARTQKKVIDIVRKHGGYIYKNAQNMYTEKGRPDLTACIPVSVKTIREVFGDDATIGLFVGIEMKRPGKLNTVSEAQEIVGRQIQKSKGMWIPVDNPNLIEALMIKLVGASNV